MQTGSEQRNLANGPDDDDDDDDLEPPPPSTRDLRVPRKLADFGASSGTAQPARMLRFIPPRAGFVAVVIALLGWTRIALRFTLGTLFARLTRGESPERRARRMRVLLERHGGTARKIGMQFALRIDLQSLEMCAELSKLKDAMPPFKLEEATRLVEVAMGKRLQEAFQTFDPEPIVSNTICCIYQAVLDNGDKVAVKVRRPGITKRLMADLRALQLLIASLEILTIVRPGRFSFLRRELSSMIFEELDFVLATRLQRMYRNRLRTAKLDFATTAKIYTAYTTQDVVISAFVAGVWLDEVLQAQEEGDEEALAYLAERDIDPARVGKRLLQVEWWGSLENVFFTTCPLPSNIVVQPGNKIVFVNIGDCDILPHKKRRMVRELFRAFLRNDASSAARPLMELLSPLPFIDTGEFRRRLETRLWGCLFAMRNPESPWWERTTTGIWMALVDTAREYKVSIRLDVVRLMQASIMYDILAGRLWPKLNILREFDRYMLKAEKRKAREWGTQMQQLGKKGMPPLAVVQASQNAETVRRMTLWGESIVESLPVEYYSLSKKSSYAISVLVNTFGLIVAATIIPAGVVAAAHWQSHPTLIASVRVVVSEPVYLAFVFMTSVIATRVIRFRLRDRDRKSSSNALLNP